MAQTAFLRFVDTRKRFSGLNQVFIFCQKSMLSNRFATLLLTHKCYDHDRANWLLHSCWRSTEETSYLISRNLPTYDNIEFYMAVCRTSVNLLYSSLTRRPAVSAVCRKVLEKVYLYE